MKIIELLNKIANGENISNNYMQYFNRQDQKYDICLICLANLIYKLDNDIIELNDEVEIIEEEKKIPEKLGMTYMKKIDDDAFITERFSQAEQKIVDTVDALIDYFKSKGENK